LNKLELISGRMPKNKHEALVEKSIGHIGEINIGEKLRISETNKDYEDIDDTYGVKEFEVVGIVRNPSHFSVEIERTNIGNGRINAIVYVDESSYSLDVYTDFYITLKDTSPMTAFTDEYEDYVKDKVDILEDVGKAQSTIRDREI
jgi:putative ABC transport system permease protein